MFLDCVIGRRGIAIQLPPYSLAKNIILKPILKNKRGITKEIGDICSIEALRGNDSISNHLWRTDPLPPTIAILQRILKHHSIGPKDSSNFKKEVWWQWAHGASSFDSLR
jgi:hypothetical protein